MSNVTRRKSFTGLVRRPPLHRYSSDTNVSECAKPPISVRNCQDLNSSHFKTAETKEENLALSADYGSEDHVTPEKTHISKNNSPDDETDDSDSSKENTPTTEENIRNEEKLSDNEGLYKTESPTKKNISWQGLGCIMFLIPLFATLCWTTQSPDLNIIKKNFLTQNEELWLSFESGVEDVIKMGKPSTFMFLYEEEAEETLTKLIDQLAKYAACEIRSCSKEPLELTNKELNSPEVIRNFGILIDKYKEKLQEHGLMTIKNIENVSGTSAQVFHTFCDEITPLVESSLFIFTMKVGRLPECSKRMRFVEEYFKSKWTDLKVDTLNALITRITSMVLEIRK